MKLLFAMLLMAFSALTAEPAVLSGDFQEINLQEYAEERIVLTETPRLEDLAGSEPWVPLSRSATTLVDFVSVEKGSWLKVRIANNSAKDHFVLHLPWYKVAEVAVFLDNGKGKEKLVPEANLSQYAYRFNLEKGQEAKIFIFVSVPMYVQLAFYIRSEEKFLKEYSYRQLFLGLYFGILAAMLFYNLFLLFSIREKLYFLYCLMLLFFLFYQMAFNGYYLWIEIGNYYIYTSAIGISLQLWLSFLLYFSYVLLRLDQVFPFSRVINIFIISILIYYNYAYKFNQCNWEKFLVIVDSAFAASMLFILISAIYSYSKKIRQARFFLIGYSSLFSGMVVYVLYQDYSILPENFLIKHSITIGSAMEMLLFAFALADRYNILKLEKETAQSEAIAALEKSDKMKDEFFAGITHELRTPLNGIVSIAEHQLDNRNLEAIHKDTSIILASAKRLTSLVNDVLDQSRLKIGDLQLKLAPVSLQAIAGYVFELNRVFLQGRPLVFQNSIVDDFPAVFADQARLEQILENLVSNALKFTREGKIEIAARIIGDQAEISVTDSGEGIALTDREKIFDMYAQSESGKMRGGTGIGLYLVRELVRLHGGIITVHSEPGKGASFRFTLPLANASAGNIITEIHSPDVAGEFAYGKILNPGHKLILLIDDEPVNHFILHRQLDGFSVLHFTNPQEALDAVLSGKFSPDVVLLDIMMPVLNGLEVCRYLRQKFSPRDLPVIMVSVKNDTQDLLASLNAGANDYIVKPYAKEVLLHHLDVMLSAREIHSGNSELENKLVSEERQRIYRDLHDHLGGKLTDLVILMDKLNQSEHRSSSVFQEMHATLHEAATMLKDRMLGIEDLSKLADNFAKGLNLVLLRRYSSAGRTLVFKADVSSENWLNGITSEDFRNHLYSVCSEIATNDLKYGEGRSEWDFSFSANKLHLIMLAGSRYTLAQNGTGRGTGNIQHRVSLLKGNCSCQMKDKMFRIEITI